jgi:hypothetical protein
LAGPAFVQAESTSTQPNGAVYASDVHCAQPALQAAPIVSKNATKRSGDIIFDS